MLFTNFDSWLAFTLLPIALFWHVRVREDASWGQGEAISQIHVEIVSSPVIRRLWSQAALER